MRKIINPNTNAVSRRKSLWDELSYADASVLYRALNVYTLNRNLPEDVRKRAENMKVSLKERLIQNGIRIRRRHTPK